MIKCKHLEISRRDPHPPPLSEKNAVARMKCKNAMIMIEFTQRFIHAITQLKYSKKLDITYYSERI
jgi:hypothetical protein